MDPTFVPGTLFESQFQICVYEHAILRIYISFFSNNVWILLWCQVHVLSPNFIYVCMNMLYYVST